MFLRGQWEEQREMFVLCGEKTLAQLGFALQQQHNRGQRGNRDVLEPPLPRAEIQKQDLARSPSKRVGCFFKHSFSKDYSHCSISVLYGNELNLQAHTVMAAIKHAERW